ncbi:SIR2 family protein [Cohaesibacter marisflavi]|nr:SIR2 family protein [Cohaesibacter marisflavi]
MQTDLYEHLSKFDSSPILFVGSGFSRRYLGLEDWFHLLAKFSEEIGQNINYYVSSSNGSLPAAASLLAMDYHNTWWNEDKYSNARERYSDACKVTSSALKIEIARYIKEISETSPTDETLQHELELLQKSCIDGIITTNWDLMLERLFPEYKVFIGQEGAIFNNFQGVGEIFKIHGCCSDPNSQILTEEDYNSFDSKYPYLTSKLLTFFVEHPVIFIGYSLSDTNIVDILRSIGQCLSGDSLEKLRDRIIVIDWKPEEEPTFSDGTIKIGETTVPIKTIRTNSFIPVFSALASIKRRFPANVLRELKEYVFDLVRTNDPKGNLLVADIDSTNTHENLEVVFGVGAITKYHETGYKGLNRYDLCRDLIFDNGRFDPGHVLSVTMPDFPPASYFPVFKYLREAGRIMEDGRINTEELCDKVIRRAAYTQRNFNNPGAVRNVITRMPEFEHGLTEFYEAHGFTQVLAHSSKQDLTPADAKNLKSIIRLHFDEHVKNGKLLTPLAKIICLYDWLDYRYAIEFDQ